MMWTRARALTVKGLVGLLVSAVLASACAKGSGAGTAGDCGNGVRDTDEVCEGFDLGGASCTTLGLGTGTLRCGVDCTFDTSGCSQNAFCGNGVREAGEDCDQMDLGGMSCTLLNLGSGNLGCAGDCQYDTSGCSGSADCGNNIVEGTEECDGSNLAGKSCATMGQGFTGGTLTCDANCAFNTSQCTTSGPVCGDNVIDAGEQCDGTNLAGATCVSLGFGGGALACSASCAFDTTGCTTQAEVCDNGTDDDGDTFVDCADADCYSDPVCGGSAEICNNGLDDDQDSYTDCDDVDCSSDPTCGGGAEICDNGTDDDGNFLCDCMDIFSCLFECLFVPVEETNCTDGVDDDLDCEVDCADADCAQDPACGGTPEDCTNGIDDNNDNRIDCYDPDCYDDTVNCPLCTPSSTISCGSQESGSNAGGPERIVDYGCAQYSDTGAEAYYVFSTANAADVTVTISANEDLDLVVVGDTGGGACDPSGACEGASQTTGGNESVQFSAAASATYYIVVDGYAGATDNFTLEVTCQ